MHRAARFAFVIATLICTACVDDPAVVGDADFGLPDQAVDLDLPPVVDARPDVGRRGEFGEPCEEDAECVSGYCVEAREAGRICTRTCGECPAGFECAPIGNAGPDRTFVCLTDQPDVCKPCETDRECDDPADLCLPIGLRTYCGEDCSADGVCPEGYACFEFEREVDGEPTTVRQCAPADGEGCEPCRDGDGDGYGTGADCLGPDCDDEDPATHPGADERCDDRDNDCDARSDEGLDAPPPEAACLPDGVCAGTRPACDDGAWVCAYPAIHEADGEASCDGLDNDCDGAADEDFDRQSDPDNCGFCDTVCAFAHAGRDCREGRCVMLDCDEGWHDADRDPGTGCEYACFETREGAEACDAIDNDCDGAVDEGLDAPELCDGLDNDCDGAADEDFDLITDVANCGACGRICDLPGAAARCEGGQCLIGGCQGGFVDLDGDPANGCEYACQPTRGGVEACDGVDNDCNGVVDDGIDVASDLVNCGRCGNACVGQPNRGLACVEGACVLGDCDGGFVDANGRADDGCEYACTPTGAEVCDGADNDCDTATDEGTLNACGRCGPVPIEVCDGDDDDCDGRTDEGLLNACGRCGAVPVETCNGVDDDCNGVVDDHGVCGPYIAQRCRVFLAVADNNRGPASGSLTWSVCPGRDRQNAGDVRCAGTRRDGRFARLQFSGEVDDNDQIAVSFICDDGANPALAAYMQSHCAVFWGHGDNNASPDDSPVWGPCPQAGVGRAGQLGCTSSGLDGAYRKVNLRGEVDGNDGFGFAWICRDEADPRRAAALQQSVDVFVGWADNNRGPADGSASWGPCPNQAAGEANGQRCVSTRGNGRFHLLRLGGQVDDNDQLGVALRARAAP